MSTNNYYRVDALRNDGKAGDQVFVRGANFDEARKNAATVNPDLRDGWTLTPTKIKKEDYPVDRTADELVIPPIEEVVKGADSSDPTPEQSDQYNAWATEFVREALEEKRAAGETQPYLLTRYPHDTVSEDDDSRDLVTLGRHGEVATVDTGSR